MRKKVILFLLFMFMIPAYASAMEITSPFGWRTHPVFGTQRFHSGVDVAADYGDNVVSAMGGVVSFAGYNNGYGYTVIVDHPDGTQTLYAHNNNLYVAEGQSVAAGQLLAAAGSTGYSTGPHVHIEYLVNGNPVDPVPLLTACGWDLTGGTPVVIDGEYASSDADEMFWDPANFYDVARQVRQLLNDFAAACQSGLAFITEDAMTLLKYLLIIDFALSAIFFTFSKTEEDFVRFFINKFLKYGFILFLILNWKEFVNTFILDSFTKIAITAGGGGSYIGENISDPAQVIQKGFFLTTPVFNYITQYSGLHLIANVHNVLMAIFLGFAIIACFAFIGIQFFLAYVEFYIIALLSIIAVPFSIIKQMKFLGEKSIGAVIAVGIKLMAMTFVVALIVNAVKDFTATAYDSIVYLRILFASLGMAFFTSRIPKTITNLLSGSPKF